MKGKNNFSTFPIFLAFLCMGFGDASGQLVSVVEKAFNISPFAASLVSFSGMIMFGVLSIPLGIIQSRVGKKKILLMGLLFFLLGALLPVVGFSFPVILLAVLLIGAGAAILQVSGQPMMRDVSPAGKFSRNLSFAQSVKAVGTLSTSLIIFLIGTKLMQHSWFTVPAVDGTLYNAGFRILFPVFAVILFITLVFIFPLKIKNKTDESVTPASGSSCFKALKTPFIACMVIGIFLYCGAEASLFNRIPGLLEQAGYSNNIAGNIVLILALVVGRFGGGMLLNRMKPVIFLIITSILAIIGNLMFFVPENPVMLWVATGLVGLAIANIFPLIFSITVDKFPDKANEISGLMVTAIVGAAIVPLLTGYIANTSLMYSFCVPLACIFYVLFTALSVKNKIR
jgi:fucose permease